MMELEEKVLDLCSTFLSGPWKDTTNVHLQQLTQGFASKTFRCSLINKPGDPSILSDVVLHIYGCQMASPESKLKGNGEAGEAIVVNALHRIGMAPKLLGVFPGGRIEEYIHSRTGKFEDFLNPEVNRLVAKKMARIHSLNIPISKVPNKISRMKEMIQELLEKANKKMDISRFDPLKEMDWYVENIPKISAGPPVFSHNDLNPNNILLIHDEVTSELKDLMIIDYEMCCYYYRAVDFANFFEWRQMQLEKDGDKMKLISASKEFKKLSQDLECLFLEEYRKECGIIRGYQDPHQDSMEQLLMEVEFGKLYSSALLITFVGNLGEPSAEKSTLHEYYEETLATYGSKKLSLIEKYGHRLS